MAAFKTILFSAIGLTVAVTGGMFVLGQASQRGSAAGIVRGTLAPCPTNTSNCVSSEAGTPDGKRVEPFPLESWETLPAMIEDMGGEIISTSDGYIAASFTSGTFGFVDDLELRKGDDAVHVRSASRVGYSDMGVNLARVGQLRDAVFAAAPEPVT
ncbi:hypothetical protein EH30_07080 [Erythrobacter sp. JL475]|nr:hypothetical protein EH30_07080 [Erythrobacter sp. JL475]